MKKMIITCMVLGLLMTGGVAAYAAGSNSNDCRTRICAAHTEKGGHCYDFHGGKHLNGHENVCTAPEDICGPKEDDCDVGDLNCPEAPHHEQSAHHSEKTHHNGHHK